MKALGVAESVDLAMLAMPSGNDTCEHDGN
jgi:hypothetical protein